jgi:ankyrin repeat protein
MVSAKAKRFYRRLSLEILLVLIFTVASTTVSAQSADLFKAVEHGDLPRVTSLLVHKANVNASRENGWSVLMAASSAGRLDIVKVLLAKGAAINARTATGWNAMLEASQEGHLEVVKELLANGANSVKGFHRLLLT